MSDNNIAEELYFLFLTRNYTWKYQDGEDKIPTAEDIQAVLDKAIEVLENETDAQLEVGRLIFKKRSGVKKLDVFIYLGEINEDF